MFPSTPANFRIPAWSLKLRRGQSFPYHQQNSILILQSTQISRGSRSCSRRRRLSMDGSGRIGKWGRGRMVVMS